MNVKSLCLTLLAAVLLQSACSANKVINLPAPVRDGGKGVLTVMNERRTDRNFLPDPIPQQELSNLLWTAYGINRDNGKRTVPLALNKRNMDVYVADAAGLWLYDPEKNTLTLKESGDARTGQFKNAPITLYFAGPKDDIFKEMHAGSMYQNAGLYAASIGLGNVVCYRNVPEINEKFKLEGDKKFVITQSFGWINKEHTLTP